MAMVSRKGKTAAELLAELREDPEHVRMRAEQEEALRHRRKFREQAEKPLVRDLRNVGCQVDSVWDLVNTKEPYPRAIPVLMEHLDEEYPAKVREGVARALAVPVLESEDWESLLAHFMAEEPGETKWALALALAANAREAHRVQLIELVSSPEHGKGRAVLAEALHRFPSPETSATLQSLATDPEIGASLRLLLETGTTVVE